jgi:hypothetical protein
VRGIEEGLLPDEWGVASAEVLEADIVAVLMLVGIVLPNSSINI